MEVEVMDALGNKKKLSIECFPQRKSIQVISRGGDITKISNYDAENSMDAEFVLHDCGLSDGQVEEILPEVLRKMKFPY